MLFQPTKEAIAAITLPTDRLLRDLDRPEVRILTRLGAVASLAGFCELSGCSRAEGLALFAYRESQAAAMGMLHAAAWLERLSVWTSFGGKAFERDASE
jgi:hypothetical protein